MVQDSISHFNQPTLTSLNAISCIQTLQSTLDVQPCNLKGIHTHKRKR